MTPKRPRDPNQQAKSIIDIADTGADPILHARVNLGTVFADITEPGNLSGPSD
jgi:hypothetical protein